MAELPIGPEFQEIIDMLTRLGQQNRAQAPEIKINVPPNYLGEGPSVCLHNRPWEDWCLECWNETNKRAFNRIANLEDHLDFAYRVLIEHATRAPFRGELRDAIQQHLDDLHKGIDNA